MEIKIKISHMEVEAGGQEAADSSGGGGRRGRGGGRGRGRGRSRESRPSQDLGETSLRERKKPRRDLSKASSHVAALFQAYSTILDDINDRHERLVKLSRDVTIGSKRLIFLLQRNDEREVLLKQAEVDLMPILANLEQISLELQGHEYWQYRRAFSPGLQEFIEAVSFLHFTKHSALITLKQVDELIQTGTPHHTSLYINDEDYLLGIADLTGELMRKAIGAVNVGEVDVAHTIRDFMQAIYEGFQLVAESKRDLRQKMGVMESSVKKVENACLTLCIQGVEKIKLLGAEQDEPPFQRD